jgi:hypothetical protein
MALRSTFTSGKPGGGTESETPERGRRAVIRVGEGESAVWGTNRVITVVLRSESDSGAGARNERATVVKGSSNSA